jgi:ligand-binding sensor protein
MTGINTRRFELLDLLNPEELSSIAQALAEETGLAVGVVRMPCDDEEVPKDPQLFDDWRLTAVFNQSKWCQTVRKFPRADTECMWSDLQFAKKAVAEGKPLPYRCRTCALTDIIEPIMACRQHVANIYVGQARSPDATVDTCFKKFAAILKESGVQIPVSLESEMQPYFRELPVLGPERVYSVKQLLANARKLISHCAERQGVLKVIENVSTEVGRNTGRRSLEIFMDELNKLLAYDTGSMWLVVHTAEGVYLESRIVRWGGGEAEVRIPLAEGKGLITYVASRALEKVRDPGKICKTRAEMDSLRPSAVEDSRDIRGLRSIAVVPIRYGEECVGVLELGSRSENFFSTNDKYLLDSITSYAGVLIQIPATHDALLEILAKGTTRSLCAGVADGLRKLVSGTGISVFLRYGTDPSAPAVLAASSEIPSLVGRAFYEPGDGLTGWVLKTGRVLRIPGGPGARTSERLREIDPELEWHGNEGKYAVEDHSGIDYADKAFIGVPIKTVGGEIMGVLRVAARITGDFTDDDEKAVIVCADHIGAAAGSQGMRSMMLDLMREVRELRADATAERHEILAAIRRSPHTFVMLLSKVAIIALGISLALYYTFGFRTIDPRFAWFGCFALGVYWLMGRLVQWNQKETLVSQSSKEPES